MANEVRTIEAVEKTVQIIRIIHRKKGATLDDLSKEIDLTKGTLHTHLRTLEEEQLVKHKDNQWGLSNQFIGFGDHVRNQNPLYQAGKKEVDELAQRTQEIIHLIVEDYGSETILYEAFGDRAVGEDYYLYNREKPKRHLHESAAGKAILAQLSEERVHQIAQTHGLPKRTKQTITDVDKLLAELSSIEEKGYAVNDEESVLGIRAVGAPILSPSDSVLGAISCSAPTSRFDGDRFQEEIPRLVKEYTNIIEVNFQTANERI